MPTFAQVVNVTRQVPYIGLRVDFSTKEIASVVTDADIKVPVDEHQANLGTFIGNTDLELLDMFIRLLKLVDKPDKAEFLSSHIKREMIYNFLTGDHGHLFFQPVLFDQQVQGIGKVIDWIKRNYVQPFTVEELARSNNMSISRLHHQFKAITAMGPLQYQKLLRLQEARRLMLSGSKNVTTAALEVGYESPSQFSREYRRLFGLPPHRDISWLRENQEATEGTK
jgi:AraC-like DNA-binding protein